MSFLINLLENFDFLTFSLGSDSWLDCNDIKSEHRSLHTATLIGTRVFIIGGCGLHGICSNVLIFNTGKIHV